LQETLHDIDKERPAGEQLGDFLDAKEVPAAKLQVGDVVFQSDFDGRQEKYTIVGFGGNCTVNGRNVFGLPIIKRCCLNTGEVNLNNINNYITDALVMVVPKQ